MGIARADAMADAMRAAVGKAAGVVVKSETTVENFMVIKDAIATNSSGYITSYQVESEGSAPAGYQVTIKAKVSQKPLKADVALLTQSIGGMRWLVAYDPTNLTPEQLAQYDQAVDQANAYLSSKKYRYIERSRMATLQKEAGNMVQEDANGAGTELTYAQQLGMQAGAQFIILLTDIGQSTRSEAFDTRTATRVTLKAKAFDNCTGEGLATVPLEGDWQSGRDAAESYRTSLTAAVTASMPKVMETVLGYIGDWANNGVPYELRFYGLGGYRDLRALREKLTTDALFGGQLELTSVNNYTRLNGTFKRKPEQMADYVLDKADEVPAIAARKLDVRFMFGRQINFAPTGVKVPEIDKQAAQLTDGQQALAPQSLAPKFGATKPKKAAATAKPKGKK
jgi:hypothetical protein